MNNLTQQLEDARTEAVALRATEQNLTEQLAAWKAALTPLMPGDFKDWHENHDSELPQVAAFVVANLRARIAELEASANECGSGTGCLHKDAVIDAQAGRIAELEAAQPERQPMQWQPIETAPRDGTAILVSEGRSCYCVEWIEEFDWWAVDDNKLGPFRLRGQAPIHWMPLPPPPPEAKEKP